MADNVAVTAGVGTTVATDEIAGIHHQKIKIEYGDSDSATQVSPTNPLPVERPKVASATVTQVGDATASTQLANSNAARSGLIVTNQSSAVLYLKYGSGASATSLTVVLNQGDTFEMPSPIYTGTIFGAWASDAGGFAYVTEW